MSPLISHRDFRVSNHLLLSLVATLILLGNSALASEQIWQHTQLADAAIQPEIVVADADVLTLSDDIKAILDEQISPITNPAKRTQALHELLFAAGNHYITYQGQHTRTAMETFTLGGGNCVSLANLYVAAARHVGLNAHFQESKVPQNWEDREDDSGYYVVAGHVNVLVKVSKRRQLTVEFLQTYLNSVAETRVMSDDEAVAQYYNNLGMTHLHTGEAVVARAYIQKALDLYDGSALIWSNMGVIEKHLGDLAAAEHAYLTALRHDEEHSSAAKNLYVLYMQTDRKAEAKPYAEKVEQYNRRNPYYLNKLANRSLANDEHKEAIKLLKQAIRIKNTEDKFYFSLAQAYYSAGNIKRSTQAMKKARNLAEELDDKKRYQRKIAVLETIAQR